MNCDVAIVGGGLTGLAVALELQRAGISFQMFEARERFGGRILSPEFNGAHFDLGPSWYWPGQPRVRSLIGEFGLEVFEQHSTGHLLHEDTAGNVQAVDFSTMAGALRVKGGLEHLINHMVKRLPPENLNLGAKLVSISADQELNFANGRNYKANTAILALPPRLAASIEFNPLLPTELENTMKSVPTWMAGHAKFVAVYESAFWRGQNLSGDAMSQRGPMAEIHDASPCDESMGALFGFLGVPANVRARHQNELSELCVAQLRRLFGAEASKPLKTWFLDWTREPETAVEADQVLPNGHPLYRPLPALPEPWQNWLIFGGTETASEYGGLVEGALASAHSIVGEIVKKRAAQTIA